MLIIHNLKAGWRNILKYKVQNTISVLCLSFGVICFAFTLYYVNEHLIQKLVKQYDNEVELTIWKDHETAPDITIDQFNQLEKLSCVKEIPFCCSLSGCRAFESKDDKGNIEYSYEFKIIPVNKSWLRKHNYESTTGKKLEDLKNGDILIDEKNIAEQFGPNAKPLEFVFDFDNGKEIKANDIVRTSGHRFQDAVYVVTDFKDDSYKILTTQTEFRTHEYKLNVTLNNYSDIDKFRESAKKIFPEYRVELDDDYKMSTERIWLKILATVLLLTLGASVLIIGISGYLKMQFQLFEIRSREIVLRRCNGAKPRQLFALLCSELGIIFLFTLIVAILIDSFLSNKLVHYIIHKDGWATEIETSFPGLVIFLTIITFIISVLIAWFRVRKIIKVSPNTYISNSHSNKSIWNSSMQIVQYAFAIDLFFIIISASIAGIGTLLSDYSNDDIEKYKRTYHIYTFQDFDSLWTSHPAVDKTARIQRSNFYVPKPTSDGQASNDSVLKVSYTFDTNLASIFDMEIQQSSTYKPKDEFQKTVEGIPVFAKAEEIDSLMKVLKLNYKRSTKIDLVQGNCNYIRLGYSRPLPFYPRLSHAYYVITDFDKYKNSYNSPYRLYYYKIILTKEGKAEEYKTDMTEACKKSYMTRHAGFKTIYDSFFETHKNIVTIIKVCTILMIISLLCIIITVYSSIALETRGRQKEVAIRKVNGAKTWDIVKIFSRYYAKTLSIAFGLGLIIPTIVGCVATYNASPGIEGYKILLGLCILYCLSFIVITLVTILTVWQKIYKISHINPALLIKKE